MANLDGSLSGDAVGKVAGVEVALQATNGEDERCCLDLLLDLRMANGADIDL